MKAVVIAALAALAGPAAVSAATPVAPTVTAQAADWRALDPENTLVIDTTKGRIVLELSPQAAPRHVERLKQLAREGFYDGIIWHRVINDFMAQTGDPEGTGQGGSSYPDLQAEFTFRRGADVAYASIESAKGQSVGFAGLLPVQTQADDMMLFTADQRVPANGLFCSGVAGMARTGDPNTANSQFFLMRGENHVLDKNYTAFGRVASGLDVVRKLATGEPPASPDKMLKVRVMADMPAAEQPKIKVLDVRSKAFTALVDKVRKEKGAAFSVCDVDVPTQGA
ncbi:peptidylprolyl isomerase [Caulobacter sp. 17J80-11]|uniref:peptidylprolyl isomerase n=1 Tax=Caulobacter sp. 17J80-11 TaxID=2763502 RepID=UPI0021083B95|nr:peptidylprolyl isomerase [Caulobacter sp. 17J80-11]